MMARKRLRSGVINIPMDLKVEVLKRLPAKSLARFQCVSKQWKKMIRDFIIIKSIVTRSLTPPQRNDPHFIFERMYSLLTVLLAYSYAYPHQTTYGGTQLYQEEIIGDSKALARFQYVRGLIGFWSSCYGQFVIHNPTTRQFVFLPDSLLPPKLFYLFGYDPCLNQYKVLCLTLGKPEQSCLIFTFGDPEGQWRNIQCGIGYHTPYFEHVVCINGTIYYQASTANGGNVIVSFDVRSEKFNHVQPPEKMPVRGDDATLVNYQGKLGCITRNNLNKEDVDVWVMENAEKQEWSKITYIAVLQGIPNGIRFAVNHPGGKIVIVRNYYSKFAPEVYYFDPNKNSRRRVEIQTTNSEESDFVRRIWPVTDHVENIMCLS